jgi:hypothetical protein
MKLFAPPSIAFGVSLMCAGPAVAQFGNPFDPPRPPGSVPVRPQPQPPPQAQPQWQGQPPGPPNLPATPAPSLGRPGAIQSEDLPPPGGAQPAALPQPGSAMAPGQSQIPSGQRQPRAGLPPLSAPAAAAPAPPAADVVTAPPAQRISNPTAVFSGLDKFTGRITAFDAAIGETVQFGALQVTARACYSRPPTETPLTDGFVEVDEVTLQGEVRRVFTGWMFAASPGLHAVEHAVYDVWLVDCKGGAQAAVADTQPTTPAAAPPRQGTSQQRQGAPQQRQRQNVPPGR